MGNKKNKIFLVVLVAVTLILTTIGLTFAFFTALIENSNVQNISVVASKPTSLVYNSDAVLSLTNAKPSDSDIQSFTVFNSDSNNMHKYDIELVIDNNTFNDDDGSEQLLLSIVPSTDGDSEVTLAYENSVDLTTVRDTDDPVAIVVNQVIDKSETHTYEVTLLFDDIGVNQNQNQNASFSAHFKVFNDRTVGNSND